MDLKDWREDYNKYSIDETQLPNNPFELFKLWFDKAAEDKNTEPNAMVLSTAFENKPSSRVLLLKEILAENFVFYTNYLSRKGKEIETNPFASILFFWPVSQRQVRIEGEIKKGTRQEAIEYFRSRPLESQISAISSPQSKIISKSQLFNNVEMTKDSTNNECPEHWGGYHLSPRYFEFWQGQPGRLHDRIVYKKSNASDWEIYRLAP